jgi:adenylylsulfate kinase-like enzyme
MRRDVGASAADKDCETIRQEVTMGEHLIHAAFFLLVACVSYYAGSRGWLRRLWK